MLRFLECWNQRLRARATRASKDCPGHLSPACTLDVMCSEQGPKIKWRRPANRSGALSEAAEMPTIAGPASGAGLSDICRTARWTHREATHLDRQLLLFSIHFTRKSQQQRLNKKSVLAIQTCSVLLRQRPMECACAACAACAAAWD